MKRVTGLVLLLLGLMIASTSAILGQSIKISPSAGYVTVDVGKTLQYTATVTGLSSTAVTWYAGGVKGGNATAGTISATVYTPLLSRFQLRIPYR
jgi:hypothetical protein